jgi:hypothetical protein
MWAVVIEAHLRRHRYAGLQTHQDLVRDKQSGAFWLIPRRRECGEVIAGQFAARGDVVGGAGGGSPTTSSRVAISDPQRVLLPP